MYLESARVAEPPAEGWPEITAQRFCRMYKSEQAIELLRHLPYISNDCEAVDRAVSLRHNLPRSTDKRASFLSQKQTSYTNLVNARY